MIQNILSLIRLSIFSIVIFNDEYITYNNFFILFCFNFTIALRLWVEYFPWEFYGNSELLVLLRRVVQRLIEFSEARLSFSYFVLQLI